MADRSGIEWTDATWNPMTGCTKVSAGCDYCYAETFAERFRRIVSLLPPHQLASTDQLALADWHPGVAS